MKFTNEQKNLVIQQFSLILASVDEGKKDRHQTRRNWKSRGDIPHHTIIEVSDAVVREHNFYLDSESIRAILREYLAQT